MKIEGQCPRCGASYDARFMACDHCSYVKPVTINVESMKSLPPGAYDVVIGDGLEAIIIGETGKLKH